MCVVRRLLAEGWDAKCLVTAGFIQIVLNPTEYKTIADGTIKTWTYGTMDGMTGDDFLQGLNDKLSMLINKFSTLTTKDEIKEAMLIIEDKLEQPGYHN